MTPLQGLAQQLLPDRGLVGTAGRRVSGSHTWSSLAQFLAAEEAAGKNI